MWSIFCTYSALAFGALAMPVIGLSLADSAGVVAHGSSLAKVGLMLHCLAFSACLALAFVLQRSIRTRRFARGLVMAALLSIALVPGLTGAADFRAEAGLAALVGVFAYNLLTGAWLAYFGFLAMTGKQPKACSQEQVQWDYRARPRGLAVEDIDFCDLKA